MLYLSVLLVSIVAATAWVVGRPLFYLIKNTFIGYKISNLETQKAIAYANNLPTKSIQDEITILNGELIKNLAAIS